MTETRRIFDLAWPAALGMLAMMSMSVLDTVMVGQLGKEAQGAVSVAYAWIQSFAIINIGVTRALDPVVAQANGAGNRLAGGQALARMLALTVPMAAAVVLWQLATPFGVRALGQPVALIPLAGGFAAGLAWGVPAMLAVQAVRQFLSAIGIVRPATVTMLAVTALKLPLNLLLIPRFGVAGAAYASSITWWAQLAILTFLTRETLRAWWPSRIDWSGTGGLLALGLPIGFQMATEIWGFATMSVMMGWLGATELASHAVAMTLASVAFMLPLGISTAAATRVGTLLGASDDWVSSARRAIGMGVSIQLVSSIFFLVCAPWLAMPFNTDPDVRHMATSLIRVAGGFQLFDGLQVIAFGILRGAGDVRLPTLANIVGYWFIGVPLAYDLGFTRGMGAVGIWLGLSVGLAFVAATLLVRVAVTARRGGVLVAVA